MISQTASTDTNRQVTRYSRSSSYNLYSGATWPERECKEWRNPQAIEKEACSINS